ncbi:hypothetical protein EMGBD2_08740 [Nitrospirota bacterium]|nr:hypothetical protein EMGBD2_08740 [Nitrospirota bacterium]GDX89110.1 hypothetical protein LBMAG45_09660 [Nitrospirota bacterium]
MIYKIGQKTVKGHHYSIPILPADDPIYTRGFTIGGYYSKDSFPATAGKVSPTPNVPSQTPDSSKKKPAAKRTPPPTVAKDLPPWWNRPSPADDHLELGEMLDEPSQTPDASKKKPVAKRTPRR